MNLSRSAILCCATLGLAACAAGPRVEPVQVTRFHQASALSQLGNGTIFVETAPGPVTGPGQYDDSDSLALAPYKAAIAAELATLGYRETARTDALQVAQVRVERFEQRPGGRRGPVTVGGSAGTGGFGSGVGLGVGINLGGGDRTMIGTDLSVSIRDKSSGDVLWEGRASLNASDNSQYADVNASAAAIAAAMFRGFPGNNGETIEVEISE
ncbi:MAG: DUF4136 domain-containing protein [Pontixanthobacter sp.]